MSIIVAGTIRIPVENIATAHAPLTAMIAATRGEDGCIAYSFAQDLSDPGLLHVFENWRDRAALDAHAKAPHIAAWRQAAGGLALSERSIFTYEAGEPHPL